MLLELKVQGVYIYIYIYCIGIPTNETEIYLGENQETFTTETQYTQSGETLQEYFASPPQLPPRPKKYENLSETVSTYPKHSSDMKIKSTFTLEQERNLSEAREDIVKLEAENSKLSKLSYEMKRQIEGNINQENQRISKVQSEYESKIHKLTLDQQEKLGNLETNILQLSEENEQQKGKTNKLPQQLALTKQKLATAETANVTYRKKIKDLEEGEDKLKKGISEMKATIYNKDKELVRLRKSSRERGNNQKVELDELKIHLENKIHDTDQEIKTKFHTVEKEISNQSEAIDNIKNDFSTKLADIDNSYIQIKIPEIYGEKKIKLVRNSKTIELKNLIEGLKGQRGEAQTVVDSKQITDLRQEIRGLEANKLELESVHMKNKQKINDLNKKIKDLVAQHIQTQGSEKELREILNQKEIAYNQHLERYEKKCNEHEKIKNEFNISTENHNSIIREIKDNFTTLELDKQKMEDRMNLLEREKANIKNALEHEKLKLTKSEEDKQKLVQEKLVIESQIFVQENKMKEEAINTNQQKTEYEKQLMEMEKRIKQVQYAKEQNVKILEGLKEKTLQLTEKEDELRNKDYAIKSLENKLKLEKVKNKQEITLTNQKASMKEGDMKKLKGTNEHLTAEIKEKNNYISQLSESEKQLKKKITELTINLDAISVNLKKETEIRKIAEDMVVQQSVEHKNKMNVAEGNTKLLEDRIGETDISHQEFDNKYQILHSKLVKKNKKLKLEREKTSSLNVAIAENNLKMNEGENIHSQVIENHNKEREDLLQEHKAHKTNSEKLTKDLEILASERDKKHIENEKLQIDLNNKKEAIEKQTLICKGFEEKIHNLNNQIRDYLMKEESIVKEFNGKMKMLEDEQRFEIENLRKEKLSLEADKIRIIRGLEGKIKDNEETFSQLKDKKKFLKLAGKEKIQKLESINKEKESKLEINKQELVNHQDNYKALKDANEQLITSLSEENNLKTNEVSEINIQRNNLIEINEKLKLKLIASQEASKQLKEEVSAYHTNFDDLKNKKHVMKMAGTEKIQGLNEKHKELEKHISDKSLQVLTLTMKLEDEQNSYFVELQNIQVEVQNLQDENKNLNSLNEQNNSTIIDLGQKLVTIEGKYADLENANSNMRNNHDKLTDKMEKKSQKLRNERIEKEKLHNKNKELDNVASKRDRTYSELQETHQKEKSSLNNQVFENENKLSVLTTQLANIKQSQADTQQKNNKLAQTIQLHLQEIKDLQNINDFQNKELLLTTEKLLQKESENAENQNKLTLANDSHSEMATKCDNLSTKIAKKSGKLKQERNQREIIHSELGNKVTILEEEKGQVQKNLENISKEKADLSQELIKKEKIINNLEETKSDLENGLNIKTKELGEKNMEIHKTTIKFTDIEQENSQLKSSINGLGDKTRKKKDKLLEERKQRERVGAELAECMKKLKYYETEREPELLSQLNVLENEKVNLNGKIGSLEEEINILKATITLLENNINQINKSSQELEIIHANLKNEHLINVENTKNKDKQLNELEDRLFTNTAKYEKKISEKTNNFLKDLQERDNKIIILEKEISLAKGNESELDTQYHEKILFIERFKQEKETEITDKEKLIEDQKQTNNFLIAEKGILTEELSKKKTLIDSQLKEIECKKEEIKTLSDTNTQHIHDIKRLEQSLTEQEIKLTADISKLSEENKVVTQKLQLAENNVQEKISELEKLHGEKTKLDLHIEFLNTNNEEMQNRITVLGDKNAYLKTKKKRISESANANNQDFEQKILELEEDIGLKQITITNLENDKTNAQQIHEGKITELNTKIVNLETKYYELGVKLRKLEDEKAIFVTQSDTQSTKLGQIQIDNENYKASLKEKESVINTQNSDIKNKKQKLDEYTATNKKLQLELKDLKNANEIENVNILKEMKGLATAHETVKTKLENDIIKMTQTMLEKDDKIGDQTTSKQKLDDLYKQKCNELSELERSFSEYKIGKEKDKELLKESYTNEITNLKDQIHSKCNLLEEKEATSSTKHEEQNKNWELQMDSLSESKELEKKQIMMENEREKSELINSKEKRETEILAIKNVVDKMRQEGRVMEEKILDKTQNIENLQGIIANLKTESEDKLSELTTKLTESKSDIKMYEQLLEKTDEKLLEFNEQKHYIKSSIKELLIHSGLEDEKSYDEKEEIDFDTCLEQLKVLMDNYDIKCKNLENDIRGSQEKMDLVSREAKENIQMLERKVVDLGEELRIKGEDLGKVVEENNEIKILIEKSYAVNKQFETDSDKKQIQLINAKKKIDKYKLEIEKSSNLIKTMKESEEKRSEENIGKTQENTHIIKELKSQKEEKENIIKELKSVKESEQKVLDICIYIYIYIYYL